MITLHIDCRSTSRGLGGEPDDAPPALWLATSLLGNADSNTERETQVMEYLVDEKSFREVNDAL
jgi:hypothetical protein